MLFVGDWSFKILRFAQYDREGRAQDDKKGQDDEGGAQKGKQESFKDKMK